MSEHILTRLDTLQELIVLQLEISLITSQARLTQSHIIASKDSYTNEQLINMLERVLEKHILMLEKTSKQIKTLTKKSK